MKNIFRIDNDTSVISADEITTNKLTVNTDLCLSGLNDGSLLTSTGGDSCLNELTVGTPRFILEVDQATNIPAWTNNIKVDQIESNIYKYAGTVQGDLLQVNNGLEIDRIPIGIPGQLLKVNALGNGAEWGTLVLPDPLVINVLQIDNSLKLSYLSSGNLNVDALGNVRSENTQVLNFIGSGLTAFLSPVNNILLSTFNINLISGRRYRLNLSFRYTCTNQLTIVIPFANGMPTKNLEANKPVNAVGDMFSHSYIFTSNVTGAGSFEVRVTVSPSGNCSFSMGSWSLDPLF